MVIHGLSEKAVKRCLSSRHDRSEYTLTNKLTDNYFDSEEEIIPFFESQLEACGVDYFDFYLMHAQNRKYFEKFKKCRAYETAIKLREEGRIKHFGISFHDKADVLDQILTEYPEIEVVQIQLNYLDWEDASVESRKCYEVCVKHGKPNIVMEPVKGGSLVDLPEEADKMFKALEGGSNASYAIRYTASKDNVFMVLSGMSNFEQMEDNVNTMKEFKKLSAEEEEAVEKVCMILKSKDTIPCTACHYCTDGCPMKIRIPDMFACYNKFVAYNNFNQKMYYNVLISDGHGKASECLKCGQCEGICPQGLEIMSLLEKVAETFE